MVWALNSKIDEIVKVHKASQLKYSAVAFSMTCEKFKVIILARSMNLGNNIYS